MRLTSEGDVFLREAKEILAHADRSVELARGAARGEIGSLSVGFLGSATAFFLPRIIREYRRRFPGVRLTLRKMAPAPQIDEFRAGRLDVGFTRPVPATDNAGFDLSAYTAIHCSPSSRKGIRLLPAPRCP